MLLTLTYEPREIATADPDAGAGPDESPPATALGFLLHKHPARLQTFSASVGRINVFYPEATDDRCTVALLLEVDPIGIVRSKRFRGDAGALDHYVNDRPYAASSMLAVAIGSVFRTAMTGQSDSHPELAAAALPLRIEIPAVSARGDERDLVRRLFEPCGWTVEETRIPLDPEYPGWGDSRYSSLVLTGRVRLAHALRQLYVLLPVLDDAKHYWVGDDEIAKLERNGEGWLADHPERGLITQRYLLHQRSLLEREGAARGANATDPAAAVPAMPEAPTGDEARVEPPLRAQRADAVLRALHDVGAGSVIDMGCGQGALLARLARDPAFTRIVGVDVSAPALEQAARALRLEQASDSRRARVELLHGSTVYRDARLHGHDAMVLMEVIEHVDPSRLDALEDAVFGDACSASVIVTTPNAEFNSRYPGLDDGGFRHTDHRFEWTRGEFRAWGESVADRYGYAVEFRPVGGPDPALGAPTQLALFRKESA